MRQNGRKFYTMRNREDKAMMAQLVVCSDATSMVLSSNPKPSVKKTS